MISHVQVVGSGGVFGRKRVDLLRKRRNAVSLPLIADIILGVSAFETLRDLRVRVAILLGLEHKILRHFVETDLLHLVPSLHNGLQAAQEPMINLGNIVNILDSHGLLMEGLSNGKDALIGRDIELLLQFLLGESHVGLETSNGRINHAKGLLD